MLDLHQRILLLCARISLTDQQAHRLSQLLQQVDDWGALVREAEYRLIAPQVYKHFCLLRDHTSFPSVVPEPIIELLRQRTYQLVLRNLKFAALQRQLVVDVFEPLGVGYVFVKGLSLSSVYYPPGMIRPTRDIDVLIPRDQMTIVAKKLMSLGFKSDLGPVFDCQHGAQFQKRFRGMMNWISPDGLLVEFKSAFDQDWYRFDTGHLIEQADRACAYEHEFRVLPTTELVLYLAYHHVWHHFARLHWLVDIDALVQHESFNCDEVLESAKKRRLSAMVLAMLRIYEAIASDIDTVDEVLSDPYDQKVWACCKRSLSGDLRTERDVRQVSGLRGEDVSGVRSALLSEIRKNIRRFIPSTDDYKHFPLTSSWHGLYYGLRPPLWMMRKLRAQ